MIVYLAGDIPPFVMYCFYEVSGSSLLIESVTDSMIVLLDLCRSNSFRMWSVGVILYIHTCEELGASTRPIYYTVQNL